MEFRRCQPNPPRGWNEHALADFLDEFI